MADAATPAPQQTVGRQAIRVVLFGMPDAGKSSLLGALAQAGQTQEQALNGRVIDLSAGLAELQHRVYDGAPRETLQEVVPFPVVFRPLTGAESGVEVLLVDCDGRAANEILSRRSLDGGPAGLGRAVLQADALVLVVDVSAPASQVDSDFAEFGRFLRLLRENRGQRTEVGGLPVFLVLTKCDLLAQTGDTPATWLERVEERKRWVDQRFHEYLARQQASGALPFGSIDLHPAATAVKLPALGDVPARPREPYGVAELFRQCLAAARGYRQHQRRSGRRLAWTVTGTAGAVALMGALAGGLVYYRINYEPDPGTRRLAAQVDRYRAEEGPTASARLREPLQQKISTLADFVADADFDQLPESSRDYVRGRLDELKEYRAYKEAVQQVHPEAVRSEVELDRVEDTLTNRLALPAAYREDWGQTDAARLRDRLLGESEALRRAVAGAKAWYQGQTARAEALRTFAGGKPGNARAWREWEAQAGGVLDMSFPHAEGQALPGSDRLTYGTVLQFATVARARGDWEVAREQLERLRDLTVLLGFADVPDRPALLEIPPGFTADQAKGRLEQLQKAYPRWQQELAPGSLPDAAAGELRQAAQASYTRLIDVGREVVLRRLRQAAADGQETPDLWKGLARDWLAAPGELRDWRVLATALGRFAGVLSPGGAGDPVTGLADFLRQESFRLDLQRFTLVVPFDRKLTPAGPLKVFHQRGAGEKTELTYRPLDEEGRRDAQMRTTTYTFVREGEGAVTYHPGDLMWANLAVKRQGEPGDWLLTWSRFHSRLYQFECLSRPPRLHRTSEPNTAGDLLEDVTLEVMPPDGVPRVPDLLPVVKLTPG